MSNIPWLFLFPSLHTLCIPGLTDFLLEFRGSFVVLLASSSAFDLSSLFLGSAPKVHDICVWTDATRVLRSRSFGAFRSLLDSKIMLI